MKKLLCGLMASLLVLSSTMVAFAAPAEDETSDEEDIVIALDTVDVTKPYRIEKTYVNAQGEEVTIGAVYTPNEEVLSAQPIGGIQPFAWYNWSHSYPASVGTWTSYYDGSILGQMSYDFDVSMSGSHWKISNARNLFVGMPLTQISNKSLVIGRSISAIGMPAEVTGSCTLKRNVGVYNSTIDAWIKTTVSDDGVLTVSGN